MGNSMGKDKYKLQEKKYCKLNFNITFLLIKPCVLAERAMRKEDASTPGLGFAGSGFAASGLDEGESSVIQFPRSF